MCRFLIKQPYHLLLLLFLSSLSYPDYVQLKDGTGTSSHIVDTSGCYIKVKRRGKIVTIQKTLISYIEIGDKKIDFSSYVCGKEYQNDSKIAIEEAEDSYSKLYEKIIEYPFDSTVLKWKKIKAISLDFVGIGEKSVRIEKTRRREKRYVYGYRVPYVKDSLIIKKYDISIDTFYLAKYPLSKNYPEWAFDKSLTKLSNNYRLKILDNDSLYSMINNNRDVKLIVPAKFQIDSSNLIISPRRTGTSPALGIGPTLIYSAIAQDIAYMNILITFIIIDLKNKTRIFEKEIISQYDYRIAIENKRQRRDYNKALLKNILNCYDVFLRHFHKGDVKKYEQKEHDR